MAGYDDVICLDPPARPKRKATKKPIKEFLLLHSDSDSGYGEDPAAQRQKPQKRSKKPAAAAAAASDSDVQETPPPKKQRKPKAPKEPKEKRTDAQGKSVSFRSNPSLKIDERIKRALPGSGHRMFLIDTQPAAAAAGGRSQEFAVLGATGNVYNMTISRHPHCTCPDHAKGNVCKHILFVMLRVLKLDDKNPLVWQKALLTKEVEEVLSGRHSQGSDVAGVLADERVRRAYSASAAARPKAAAGAAADASNRKPVEGDCPICFDELQDGDEVLVWCQGGCGNNVHKRCWDIWAAAKRRAGAAVTCVYCRTPWQGETPAAAAAASSRPEYLNLAQQSSGHRGADTSLEALYGDNARWIRHHHAGGLPWDM